MRAAHTMSRRQDISSELATRLRDLNDVIKGTKYMTQEDFYETIDRVLDLIKLIGRVDDSTTLRVSRINARRIQFLLYGRMRYITIKYSDRVNVPKTLEELEGDMQSVSEAGRLNIHSIPLEPEQGGPPVPCDVNLAYKKVTNFAKANVTRMVEEEILTPFFSINILLFRQLSSGAAIREIHIPVYVFRDIAHMMQFKIVSDFWRPANMPLAIMLTYAVAIMTHTPVSIDFSKNECLTHIEKISAQLAALGMGGEVYLPRAWLNACMSMFSRQMAQPDKQRT